MSDVAEMLEDFAEEHGWRMGKKLQLLLDFIEEQELDVELEEFLNGVVEDEETFDPDEEEADDDE